MFVRLHLLRAALLGALMMGLFTVAVTASSSQPTATIVVTTLNPAVAADGQCSLIEAFNNANAPGAAPHADCTAGSAGADTVQLAPNATYTLNAVHNETNGPNGLPSITSEVIIDGRGATIRRENTAPNFRLIHISASGTLTANDLILRGGRITSFGGGALRNQGGRVTLNRVTARENTSDGAAVGNRGGTMTINDSVIRDNNNPTTNITGSGIINDGATTPPQPAMLTINNTQVLSNTAQAGGAVANLATAGTTTNLVINNSVVAYNQGLDTPGILGTYSGAVFSSRGFVTVTNSTIHNNIASAGNGAGIANAGLSFMHIEGSTINNNRAEGPGFQVGNGGGIYNQGTMTVTNSTISSNAANGTNTTGGAGGGILNVGFDVPASLHIVNSTIANNTAARGGGAVGNFNAGQTPRFTFTGTLLAGNTAPTGKNCANNGGTITSQGYNLEDGTTCPLTAVGDRPSAQALLGPLANNGGPTRTHALLPGSQAIDAMTPRCLPTDQRGVVRPQDGDGNGTALCDIGAFELASAATATATASATATRTATASTTATPTHTGTPRATVTATATRTPVASVTPSATGTRVATMTASPTRTPGASVTPSATGTRVATMTASPTRTAGPSVTPSATGTATSFRIYLPLIFKLATPSTSR